MLIILPIGIIVAEPAKMVLKNELVWESTENTDIPSGAHVAHLYGSNESNLTSLIWGGVGYYIPAHTHPSNEYILVVKGAAKMFHCNKNGKELSSKKLLAGGFLLLPKGMFHAVKLLSPNTILEVHFDGKYAISYAKLADDPRFHQ